MATKATTVEYLLQQMEPLQIVSAKKMFGEYGVFAEGKTIALVCDDQLFVKPTSAGRDYLEEIEEAPPYPGAKDWLLITEDKWDDSQWLCELVAITIREVPLPPPKKKSSPKPQKAKS